MNLLNQIRLKLALMGVRDEREPSAEEERLDALLKAIKAAKKAKKLQKLERKLQKLEKKVASRPEKDEVK